MGESSSGDRIVGRQDWPHCIGLVLSGVSARCVPKQGGWRRHSARNDHARAGIKKVECGDFGRGCVVISTVRVATMCALAPVPLVIDARNIYAKDLEHRVVVYEI